MWSKPGKSHVTLGSQIGIDEAMNEEVGLYRYLSSFATKCLFNYKIVLLPLA